MKKTYFIMLIILGILCNAKFINAEEQNMLRNPSFEEGGNHLDYWRTEGNATFVGAQSWHPYKDAWSLGIGNDFTWASKGNWGHVFQVLLDPKDPTNLYRVFPGQIFSFEMWMMTEENYRGKASLKIEFFDYDRRVGLRGEPVAFFQSKIHTGEIIGKWIKENITGTVPQGTVSVIISCLSEDMDVGSRYVFFDSGVVTVTRSLL